MRVLARMVYTLAGLAVLVPAAGAKAGMPVLAGSPWSPEQQRTTKQAAADGDRLCADCLRSKVMAQKGVNIPPPPPLPPGTVVPQNMCKACGRPAAVVNGRRLPSPSRSTPPAMMADRSAPGRASVGGDAVGYAVSGSDPAPIGMVQPRMADTGAGAGRPGSRDGSVMPTSAPGRDPLSSGVGERNPRILSHLLGLSAIGRERSIARERHSVEEHARIPYGVPYDSSTVQSLPASDVYNR